MEVDDQAEGSRGGDFGVVGGKDRGAIGCGGGFGAEVLCAEVLIVFVDDSAVFDGLHLGTARGHGSLRGEGRGSGVGRVGGADLEWVGPQGRGLGRRSGLFADIIGKREEIIKGCFDLRSKGGRTGEGCGGRRLQFCATKDAKRFVRFVFSFANRADDHGVKLPCIEQSAKGRSRGG